MGAYSKKKKKITRGRGELNNFLGGIMEVPVGRCMPAECKNYTPLKHANKHHVISAGIWDSTAHVHNILHILCTVMSVDFLFSLVRLNHRRMPTS